MVRTIRYDDDWTPYLVDVLYDEPGRNVATHCALDAQHSYIPLCMPSLRKYFALQLCWQLRHLATGCRHFVDNRTCLERRHMGATVRPRRAPRLV